MPQEPPFPASSIPRYTRPTWYSDFFIDGRGSAVTDDHVQLIQAGIPAIDIIDIRQDSPNGFFKAWHTTADDMPLIDKRTLKAVGQTVTNYIFPAE